MYDFSVFIPTIVAVAVALLSVLGSYIGGEISSLRSQRKDLTNHISQITFEISYHNQKLHSKREVLNKETDIEELIERKQFLMEKIPELKSRGSTLLIYSFLFVFILLTTVVLPIMLPIEAISNNPQMYEIANKTIPAISVVGILFAIAVIVSCFKDGLKWYDCPENRLSDASVENFLVNKENCRGQERKTL